MNSLRIGQQTATLQHPHVLFAQGILSTYNEHPVERWMLDFAYLGLSIKGGIKPPHRPQGMQYALYGQMVYSWLVEQGCAPAELLKTADEWITAGFKRVRELGLIPTADEVTQLGESSTPPGSGTG